MIDACLITGQQILGLGSGVIEINVFNLTLSGRQQRSESFDHLVRLARVVDYIRDDRIYFFNAPPKF